MDIIPAIDIISGECVRLSKGKYDSKRVYSKSPEDVAMMYQDYGFKRLHIVDLDGAKSKKPMNLKTLEKISSSTGLNIQYGGGVKSEESLKSILSAGASRIICGSVAITDPDLFIMWLKGYGADKLILGADFRNEKVAIDGWETQTDKSLYDTIEMFCKEGLEQLISTDISKDGMLSGPSYEKYYTIKKRFPKLRVTISGGISSLDDVIKIDRNLIDSVIVGKAIYEGRIDLKELRKC
ncbi:MAG: 1-(5-phosphoribosyl)-5-[(5-phosphoribosylamino)methylideneamino]imidazole-4-carboxamide isomerase [Bacteroidales bacterium]